MKKRFFAAIMVILIFPMMFLVGCTDEGYKDMYDNDARIAATSKSLIVVYYIKTGTPTGIKITADSMSGIDNIKSRVTVDGSSAFSCELSVESGQAKVVLVDTTAKKVYTIAEGAHTGAVDLSGVPAGTYAARIVAYRAVGLSMEISFS